MQKSAIVMGFLLIFSTLFVSYSTEEVSADSSWSDISVADGAYQAIDLGTIQSGKEIEIDYSADDDIDVMLMSSSQYSAWQSGSSIHINSGSDYSDSGDSYVYTTEITQQYYLFLTIVIRIPRVRIPRVLPLRYRVKRLYLFPPLEPSIHEHGLHQGLTLKSSPQPLTKAKF